MIGVHSGAVDRKQEQQVESGIVLISAGTGKACMLCINGHWKCIDINIKHFLYVNESA